jgi:hypothetical protein
VESSCECGNEHLGSIKSWDTMYQAATQLVASRVVLSSTELIGWLVRWCETESTWNAECYLAYYVSLG